MGLEDLSTRSIKSFRVLPLAVVAFALAASLMDASAFDVASVLAGRFRHPDPLTAELVAGHARFIQFLATQVFIAYAAAMAVAALLPGDVMGVAAGVVVALAARFVVAWVGYPGADSVRHLLAVGDPMLLLVPAICASAGGAGCRWVRARVGVR